MADNIFLFPGQAQLKTEVERLREELYSLTMERDELLLVAGTSLEVRYTARFGSLEYSAFEAECILRRLRLRLDLLRDCLVSHVKPDLAKIEATVDAEVKEYEEALRAQLERITGTLQHGVAEPASCEDVQRMHDLYRRIARAIHPDLHADVAPQHQQLFQMAAQAYGTGDLRTLNIIAGIVLRDAPPAEPDETLHALYREKTRLTEAIGSMRASIDGIRRDFPFTVQALLEDEAQIAHRQEEIRQLTADYRKLIDETQQELDALLPRD